MRTYLALADGGVFSGNSIHYDKESSGEVILYHSGSFRYQLLTDPVNYGRIVVSDCPKVSNRWPLFSEIESFSPHLNGLVLLGNITRSRYQDKVYNLENYLASNNVPCFVPDQPNILKRALSDSSFAYGVITGQYGNAVAFSRRRVKDFAGNRGGFNFSDSNDPVRSLSTSLEFFWDMPVSRNNQSAKQYTVVAYDFGVPYSVLRNLTSYDCDIRIVPADCSPEEMIALKPEGILLAGGPGIPVQMDYAIQNISRLIGLRPILACGLGHILLGISMGAKSIMMEKPHYGDRIQVVPTDNGGADLYLTDQAHSYSLDRQSLERAGFKVSMINPIDQTIEAYENEEFLISAYAFSLGGSGMLVERCIRKFVDCMESHRTGARLL